MGSFLELPTQMCGSNSQGEKKNTIVEDRSFENCLNKYQLFKKQLD